MNERRDPFECWYSLADAAERLGVKTRTVRRAFLADIELKAAAREFFGELRLPWHAWEAWIGRQARFRAFSGRYVGARRVRGRFLSEPVAGRTEGEVRRRLHAERGVTG